MNQTDKKQIRQAVETLQNLSPILAKVVAEVKERETIEKVINQVKQLEPTIEEIMYRMSDKRDEMSDRKRDTDSGMAITEMADGLERAYDGLTDCISYLESVLEWS